MYLTPLIVAGEILGAKGWYGSVAHLEGATTEEFRGYFADVKTKRPTLRSIAAINYKEDIAASTVAGGYDVSEASVYNWLKRLERLEDGTVDAVLHDAPRSDRPRKFTTEEWNELNQILRQSADEVGIEASHWTPRIVQHLIDEGFDTEYTQRHVQDLLHEAEYTWETTRSG